jgi:spore coat protein A
MKRRKFLQATTAAGAILAGGGASFLDSLESMPSALAHIQHGKLTPFVDPLPLPTVLQPTKEVEGKRFYQVSMTQFQQQLHRDLPPTTVWGYHGSYPGPTIEVRTNKPIFVEWINNLPTEHLLPIDHTLFGAGTNVPDVRTVVHLHDARVTPENDGLPLDWFPPGHSRTDFYPNIQPATTLWYHDHAMGITRLNVYAGLAGFYLLRDGLEDGLNLPRGPFEIPIVLQDRSFHSNGQLFYPNKGVTAKHPVWVPEFFGDTAVVNGKVMPFLEVEPRKYRFRFLNGCNSRFLRLALSSGQPFYQIGSDGGFLPASAALQQLLMGPAERADVVIDFSGHKEEMITVTNDAPAPYPTGGQFVIPRFMQFRVTKPLSSPDTSSIPKRIKGLPLFAGVPVVKVRNLTLNEVLDKNGKSTELLLNGLPFNAPVTEKPKLGTAEIWSLINLTTDAHPIHLHLEQFQILDRQPFDVAAYQSTGKLVFTGPAVPRDANEAGLKDTVKAMPGEVTRLKTRFDSFTGRYIWHCHILEHEDNEMMRPYEVIR